MLHTIKMFSRKRKQSKFKMFSLFKFYVLSFCKKGALFKVGHYLRKYGIYIIVTKMSVFYTFYLSLFYIFSGLTWSTWFTR